MTEPALLPLEELAGRLRAGTSDVESLLAEGTRIAVAAPPSVALARAVLSFAAELPPETRAAPVLPLVLHAARVFEAQPDSTPSELVIAWHNVAQAARGAGEAETASLGLTNMVRTAAEREGVLDARSTMLLVELAETCHASQQFVPLLIIERRLLGWMVDSPDVSDDTRAFWLGRHGQRVLRAGPPAREDVAAMAWAADRLAARGDAPHSLVNTCSMLAALLEAHGLWAEAAQQLDRALVVMPLGAADLVALSMRAARDWSKAGDHARSSRHSLAALRRRVTEPAEPPG